MTDLRARLQEALGATYAIESELGGGGMSRVFLAEETALGRKVVVKVLAPELTAGVSIERFNREILVAARLQHAHIVPVLTAGETEGVPYFTMPFVEGESLRARITRSGRLSIPETIGMLRDVAKALAYAHERGFVHRDIKPDNVMLSGGSALVLDFGIAKAISAARTSTSSATLTQVGTAIGTPAYMAPEQAASDPSTDHRADLYSFGCMAFEALTGRPPFTATSPMKLLAAHMSEPPEPIATLRPDTPTALAALVHSCLEKDPEKRPQSATDIARLLDDATMSGVSAAASPSRPRSRAVLGSAYAIGLFAVLVAGFVLVRALGIGSAGSLLAAGRINAREPMLVADFKVTNADTALGRVLSDAARTQLSQSSVITLLPADAIADALRRMTRPVNSNLDFVLARELAQRNGIKAIIDGEIAGLSGGGAGFIVTMRLVTTDSARELASFRETADDTQGLIEAVDALARKLRGRAGESLRSVRGTPPLERATTASFEALRKYTEGVRADERLGRPDDAIALLREAVAIDSTFGEAWRKLGVVLRNSGRPLAEQQAAIEAAYRQRNRVPENVRHWIVGSYYQFGPTPDRAKAAEAYTASLRNGDSTIDNNLAMIAHSRRQFATAESLFRARERRSPFRVVYPNLALAQLRQAEFSAADSTISKGISAFPDLRVSLERLRIDALKRRGDTAAFRRIVDSMYTKGDSASRTWAVNRVINLAVSEGRLSRWHQILSQQRPALSASTRLQRLGWAIVRGDAWTTATWLRRPSDVEKRLDAALAGYDRPLGANDYLDIAVAYAFSGRGDKGRRFLARYQEEISDTTALRILEPDFSAALGEVLIAEEKPLDAVAAFRRADRLPDGPANPCLTCLASGLARAFDRAGIADSAIKYYEYYLRTYDYERFNSDQWFLAQFSRRTGELYEQKGNTEQATRHYQNFVNLWKNADPELQPQVEEVRRRLARLEATSP